jgi:putative thioredoxin
MAESSFVVDVSDQDFAREVIERSRSKPVVVDFWAPWCEPCRVLGPLLELLAAEAQGAFVLAKVDIDASPAIAQAFGIRSIPFVVAFRDGAAVSEFVGAQGEAFVRRFVQDLLPNEADGLVEDASRLAASGDATAAEAKLRAALELEASHAGANLLLATLLATGGRGAEALEALDRVPADAAERQDVDRLAARIRMRLAGGGDETGLRARVAADPADLQARLDLGRLLAARERYPEALAELLEVVRRRRDFADGEARKAMLEIFTLLGRDHAVADEYQRALARVLFS